MGRLQHYLNKRTLLLTGAALVLCVGTYVIYRHVLTFYVTAVNPSLSSVSYQSPFMKIYFNKPIKKESVKVTDPYNILREDKLTITNDELFIYTNTNNLYVDKTVSFTISLESKDGYKIDDETISFSPQKISFEKLPEDQRKVIKQLEQHKPSYYTDPVLKVIPHSTLDYDIQPNFVTNRSLAGDDEGALLINITVHLSNIDLREGRSDAIARYFTGAKDYLVSKGFNTDNYSLNLIVVEP